MFKRKRRWVPIMVAAGLLGAAAAFVEIVERIAEQERRGVSCHPRPPRRAAPTTVHGIVARSRHERSRRFKRGPMTRITANRD